MNRVVSILMLRDNLTVEEATDMVEETRMLMENASYDSELVEDILMSQLGLEPDYIFDVLD